MACHCHSRNMQNAPSSSVWSSTDLSLTRRALPAPVPGCWTSDVDRFAVRALSVAGLCSAVLGAPLARFRSRVIGESCWRRPLSCPVGCCLFGVKPITALSGAGRLVSAHFCCRPHMSRGEMAFILAIKWSDYRVAEQARIAYSKCLLFATSSGQFPSAFFVLFSCCSSSIIPYCPVT